MSYPISQIKNVLKAETYPLKGFVDSEITHLLTDSRNLVEPTNTLFIALKTHKNDGHKYIGELYNRGVRLFMVENGYKDIEAYNAAVFITVPDTLKGLQHIARWHREQFDIPVIAITGSNGKTIVKEWMYQLLSPDKAVIRSPRSFNSQIGVPLSVWQMSKKHRLAIFEAGISMPNEMERLEEIIRPTIGIFTNIGEAHGSNFKTIEQKTEEKLKLFKRVKLLIYCKDHTHIDTAIKTDTLLKNVALFTWSKKIDADVQIIGIDNIGNSTAIKALYKKNKVSVHIPFTDEASVENAIHCWAYMLYAGYENNVIAERFALLQPVTMRMEMITGINGCTVISDVYNSDINSLAVGLDFLNQQKQHTRKTLVLSDIMQGTGNEDDLYARVAEVIKAKKPSRLIGIGKGISSHSALFDLEKYFFTDTDDFLAHFNNFVFKGEAILVKGARSFSLEKVSRLLQYKAHETVLQINLDALVHNLNYFRNRLSPATHIMAMVKAFSYGIGSYEIANLLQHHRASYLAVAYTDEAIELRTSGISLPIMVMNPEPDSLDNIIRYRLEPEVYSFRVLDMVKEAIKRSELTVPFPIHIKLDTGMHRLGFCKEDIKKLITLLQNEPLIKVKSVFSHLAASDLDVHKEFTLQQIARYKEMSEEIINKLSYPVMRHILNSAGIVRYPEAQFDMVRLGIGLYGIGADAEEQKKLENVTSLKTNISQIHYVKKGETVGYNRKGRIEKDSAIATVAIGYADGYSRALGNGKGKMLVHGQIASVIGDVCMDMCMLDVTGIEAHEGDEVIVFNNATLLLQMAKGMSTIPYEVFTGLSARIKRVYTHE